MPDQFARTSVVDFPSLAKSLDIVLPPARIATDRLRIAPYGRKVGPDPASIGAAMIGGVAANNPSGMCCGTAQKSYQTLQSTRIVLADGAVLDTADATTRAAFAASHASEARGDGALAEPIRQGFMRPEMNAHALRTLARDIDGCTAGYSTSHTCEIGLTAHGGVNYRSIAVLLDSVARPSAANEGRRS